MPRKKTEPKGATITLTVPEEVKKKIRIIAALKDTSVSLLVSEWTNKEYSKIEDEIPTFGDDK